MKTQQLTHQDALSKREWQVANKVSEGLSNRSIADQLFISERTVKFHCTNIFRKLAVSNRKMLITLFARQRFENA
ncbi:LuxR C-terminal-related transcriptional regulator [Aestuariibacter halophilus]|uniref:LuxR C-terminal-related transcriptional regulator n=1 Tax=Fluctibacter halophilus TaxID=226011 RepID=A0ABS8GD90_9ALTE|nr:LuxR C-terminal-related transcriptional regulator [Aestuariibacter halophilus]MCC2618221.1 LuxR C-terminal-related transcriptional regulator [Aestuariibacter halophilus]